MSQNKLQADAGHIFISATPRDTPFVERLAKDLSEAGVRVWRAREQVQPGENWARAVEDALAAATAVVFVSSEHSSVSAIMKTEITSMVRREAFVIPVLVDDAPLPYGLANRQAIDFRGDYRSALLMLLDALPQQRDRAARETPVKKSKGYVFLSYAEEDAAFVDDAKAFLGERGYAYWDYRESDRDYDNDLFLELEQVITDAVATLSVVSSNWKRSRTAVKEYHFSTELNKPVFLLRISDPGPTLLIAGIPYIDFMTDRTRGFERLGKELSKRGL
jgi:hypothetical protein